MEEPQRVQDTSGGSETIGNDWLEAGPDSEVLEVESTSRNAEVAARSGVEFDEAALSHVNASGVLSSCLFGALALSDEMATSSLEFALTRLGLVALSRADVKTLRSETSLSPQACEQLASVFELGRLVEAERWSQGDSVRSSGGVYRLMAPKLRGMDRETFFVLLLDGRHRLVHYERVSEGTLTTSLVHPREVFRPAIRHSAAAIVVVHNHPSGDPEPSRQDYDVTRRLADCGRLVGIPLLDHVVIGHGAHVSIKDRIEF